MRRTVQVPVVFLAGAAVLVVISLLVVGLGVFYGTKRGNRKVPVSETTTTPGKVVTTSSPTPTPEPGKWRLPKNVIPVKYTLSVQPYFPPIVQPSDPKCFTFNGNLTVLMTCNVATQHVVMNMRQLEIDETSLVMVDSQGNRVPFASSKIIVDPDYERVTFQVAQTLRAGQNYSLSFKYQGELGTNLEGFYRSSYVEGGKLKWMVVTKFECCSARLALPCFDEPEFKAVFAVTIIHPSDMVALSNNEEQQSINIGDGWNHTKFFDSPKMSSYLLAMAVCAFDNTLNYAKDKILFRIWARPSAINQTGLANAGGPVALNYYSSYFNQSFPLKKQDMLSVPDFEGGAMENWGLITYRETALLYDPKTSWMTNLDRVATVVAHELAHQWFGDLVTMKFWNDIWLNEGFATYFETIGADQILGNTTRLQDQFVVTLMQPALSLDQLKSTHPIFNNVDSPSEIGEVFDDITYNKGGSLLRMLKNTLFTNGVNSFQLGLQKYIQTYRYSNADHNNLWESIDQVVTEQNEPMGPDGKVLNVMSMMNPWIMKPGYPLITATRDYTANTMTLSQKRFFINPNEAAGNVEKWLVPIWYVQDGKVTFTWLRNDTDTEIPSLNPGWVIVNYQERSFCRVSYDPQNWNLIQKQLMTDFTKIDVLNRAQLLDDSQNLARAGTITYPQALDLTKYMTKENEYIPWAAFKPAMDYFESMLSEQIGYEYYEKYIRKLLQPRLTTILANSSVSSDQYLDNFVFSKACSLNDPNCVKTSEGLFTTFANDCSASTAGSSWCSNVPPVYRRSVYCTAVANGGYERWRFLWRLYQHEAQAVEKTNLLYGICCTRQPHLIAVLLNQSVDKVNPVIRKQDIKLIFRNLKHNIVAKSMIWNYLASNIEAIVANIGNDFYDISDMIRAATDSFNTEYQVQLMANFVQSNRSLGKGRRAYMEQMELAKANVFWMQRHQKDVITWMQRNSG